MKLTKTDYIKISSMILIPFFIILLLVLNIRDNRTIDQNLIYLNQNLETYKNLLIDMDQEQQSLIEQLQNNLTDNNDQDSIGFKQLKKLEAELIDFKIELDEVSEQSLLYLFEDVYKDIELLRKKVK